MEIFFIIFGCLVVIGLFLIHKKLGQMNTDTNEWLLEIHKAIETNLEWLKEMNDKIPEK